MDGAVIFCLLGVLECIVLMEYELLLLGADRRLAGLGYQPTNEGNLNTIIGRIRNIRVRKAETHQTSSY